MFGSAIPFSSRTRAAREKIAFGSTKLLIRVSIGLAITATKAYSRTYRRTKADSRPIAEPIAMVLIIGSRTIAEPLNTQLFSDPGKKEDWNQFFFGAWTEFFVGRGHPKKRLEK